MSEKVHEETSRGTFLNPRRYVIYDDRIKIQSPLKFYWFKIPYEDVEKVEIRNPPVVWDAYKQGILFTRKYFFRIYKNDVADIYYNFVRLHMSLNGGTPTVMASSIKCYWRVYDDRLKEAIEEVEKALKEAM